MPKKPSQPPQGPPTWPKHLAVRRLKEALEKIPALEGLNHLDPAFEAWHEDLSRILKANWPSEYLPNFWDMRITPFGGGPVLSESDLAIYKQDMLRTKTRIELILRNEREIAEAEGNAIVTEIFLPPGSQHDAYAYIRQIVSAAVSEILIIDNYVDSTIFALLTNLRRNARVSILTFNLTRDFGHEADRFRKQYGISLEVRFKKADFHDRFIIVDGTKAYHLGASIKDAGEKASMIHLIEDAENVQSLLSTHQKSWAAATPAAFP